MSLVLRMQPGDKVLIGGEMFHVEPASIRLIGPDGQVINLGEDDVLVAPEVLVHSVQSQVLPGFALAFTAPSDITIIRIKGDQSR